MLLWASMISAQNPAKVFTYEASLMHKDLISILVPAHTQTIVKYWDKPYVGIQLKVNVSEGQEKYLDDITEHYLPVVENAGRITTLNFKRLNDIIMIGKKLWKEEVQIIVFQPSTTNKRIVVQEFNRQEDLLTKL